MGIFKSIAIEKVLQRTICVLQIKSLFSLTIAVCFGVLFLVASTGSQSIPQGCLPEQVQVPVEQSFHKLTPTFSPNGFFIQFKTDARISLNPMNPLLVQFLLQYYSIAINRMCQATDASPTVRSGMILNFRAAYEDFLSQIGLPMSCISYYVGTTDKVSIEQLQRLYDSLSHKSGIGSTNPDRVFTSIVGKDLAKSLGMYAAQGSQLLPKEDFNPETDTTDSCSKVFWELKDGSVHANLPSMGPLSRKIKFPTIDKTFNANQGNMTFRIQSYWSQALSCLKNDEEKANFSSTISQWISSKLFPQLMKSSSCVKGFPRILQLMISLEDYETFLRSRTVRYPTILQPPVRHRDDNENTNTDYDTDYFQQSQPLIAARPEEHDYSVLDPELLKYLNSLQDTTTNAPEHGTSTASGAVALILILIIFIVLGCIFCCLDPSFSASWKSYLTKVKEQLHARTARINRSTEYSEHDSLLNDEEMEHHPTMKHQIQPKTHLKPRKHKRSKQHCQKIEISRTPYARQDDISIAITSCDEGGCLSGEMQVAEVSESQELNSSSCSSEDANQSGEPFQPSSAPPEYKREYVYTRKAHFPQDCHKDQRKKSVESSEENSSSYRDEDKISSRYNEHPWSISDSPRDKYQETLESPELQKVTNMATHLKSQFYDRLIAQWKQTHPSLPALDHSKPRNNSVDESLEDLGPPPPPRKQRN